MLPMTRMTLIEKPPPAGKNPNVRRFTIVPLPPKHAHLRQAHD
jgi:hypothetical protein